MEDVSSFFQFSNDIRRIMYTTKYHRRIEPPVSESHENEKRIPKRFCIGKMLYLASENVIKKVDAEIPELGSGMNQLIVLYGERLIVSVRKKSRNGEALLSPLFLSLSIPSAFIILPEISDPIPEVGWAEPTKAIIMMPYLSCKKSKMMPEFSYMAILSVQRYI